MLLSSLVFTRLPFTIFNPLISPVSVARVRAHAKESGREGTRERRIEINGLKVTKQHEKGIYVYIHTSRTHMPIEIKIYVYVYV